jgi:hypothetical protein
MKQLSLESLYRQRGVSKFGLLMLLFLIASFFTIGMKVGPLYINNIRDFDLSDIRMRKQDGKAVITIAYERRVEFIANLDLVASFDTTLQ